MKKFIITLLCLAIIAGGSYGGYIKYQQVKDDKRIVDVVSVSQVSEQYYSEAKTTDALVTSGSIQNIELNNERIVKKVCVKAGDKVKKGDTLIVYDMTIVELENEQRKNQIAVINEEIKEAEKKLKRLQGLQPSENAPKETTTTTEKETEPPEVTTTTKKTTTTTVTTTMGTTTTTIPPVIRPVPTTTTKRTRRTTTTTTTPAPDPVPLNAELTSIDGFYDLETSGARIFNCSMNTKITAEFMQQVIENGVHVVLYVYNDNGVGLLYMWDINGANPGLEAAEWIANDGIIFSRDTYAYNGSAGVKHGLFFINMPKIPENNGGGDDFDDWDDWGDDEDEGENGWDAPDNGDGGDIDMGGEDAGIPEPTETEPEVPDPAGEEMGDDGEDILDIPGNEDSGDPLGGDDINADNGGDIPGNDDSESDKPVDENYMYSRSELAEKVKNQQIELKELQLKLKTAEMAYQQGLKRKEEGKEVAKIDGTVTRLKDETASADGEEEAAPEDLETGMDFDDQATLVGGFENESEYMDSTDELPYMVIQGKASVSLDVNVSELNLPKFAKDTVISGISYDNGEEFTAVVTGVKSEPRSYNSYSYGDNPNSSTFIVTAEVQGKPKLVVDHYVTVNIPGDEPEEASGDAIYLPLCYVRKEGSVYYVMKADEEGLLKKQYLRTGKIVWSNFIEVTRGLEPDDLICFPYGKDVKEGVKTRETDEGVW